MVDEDGTMEMCPLLSPCPKPIEEVGEILFIFLFRQCKQLMAIYTARHKRKRLIMSLSNNHFLIYADVVGYPSFPRFRHTFREISNRHTL
jgi:hypothetical protein